MAVKPIPEGRHTVTPGLTVPGVVQLMEFLKEAFGAEVTQEPLMWPGGSVMHAEVKIGDTSIMLGEPMGDFGPMPGNMYLYVEDADATYQRALRAGATSIMEPSDTFWGDRMAGVKDQAGNFWMIATHKEELSREEITTRAEAFMAQQAQR